MDIWLWITETAWPVHWENQKRIGVLPFSERIQDTRNLSGKRFEMFSKPIFDSKSDCGWCNLIFRVIWSWIYSFLWVGLRPKNFRSKYAGELTSKYFCLLHILHCSLKKRENWDQTGHILRTRLFFIHYIHIAIVSFQSAFCMQIQLFLDMCE